MSPDFAQNRLLMVGLGNILRGDDGVGVRLVEAVRNDPTCDVAAEIWGDNDALTVAHDLVERARPALLVDCAEMGLQPGEWRVFSETSVLFRKSFQALSTHDFGLAYALQLARNLGYRHSVRFFGVQPDHYRLEGALSDTLANRFSQLTGALLETERVLRAELELPHGR